MANQSMDRPSTTLLTLPPEIRESIYRLILTPDANRLSDPDEYINYDYSAAFVLFKLNHQIYLEARKVFRDLNVFVRIETPWPEAQAHVAFQGHVPILMKNERAASFAEHSLSVRIDAPQSPMQNSDTQHFVILLDDLEKFTKTWFYAGLSHTGLNSYLRLTLALRDPYTPSYEEKRMPKWLQRKLLLPFEHVKDLREMTVEGDLKPFASLVEELKAKQAVPAESAEYCLRETTRKKAEGNTELNAGNCKAALKLYNEAWLAMHVVVKGRQRHIHADAFFGRELREPPFEGKNGQTERLLLRVQLVANTCLAYLKLQEYEEARFWGMRTINMLREAMGADERHDIPAEDEAVLGFPAADQMGKIYYRTALACKELDDKPQARKLLRVASIYLPRDENVKKEIAACALRIG
ncbi:hypothetical protein LTR37_002685 [Vermiconidia calcicola]|uniref:Uncharacterized protein n=1 Tax=Vermiconidia calcicola TaxID=1690605 RepID=A0ACC3NSE4_9PEZI|nr:hypothetical protein LTR37_002685 [Vermiconidia calcicola]